MKITTDRDTLLKWLSEAKPLPTKTVVLPDWDSVWAQVEANGYAVFNSTYDQTRVAYAWAQRVHKTKIQARSIADGVWVITKR
jgi:hypothetical protein